MTEPAPAIPWTTRLRWWLRIPSVVKVTVYPGRPAYISPDLWAKAPIPPHEEWAIGWGGREQWRIRRGFDRERRHREGVS